MSPDENSLLYRRAGSGLGKAELRAFASDLRDHVAGGRTFICLLTDDRELQRLNRTFLGKDYATDVLSFPSGAADTLGDLAISVDRAREQAERYGHRVEDEIRVLMLHGVLHLLGFDHERDRGSMAKAEKRWRKKFALPGGLIERVGAAK